MERKKQSGITLVALVVTIVVLLILAGVSINLVLGENGLISNAKEAREKTKNAEVNEKTQIDSASDFISEVVNNAELPQTNETKPYMPGDGFIKVDGTNLANGIAIQDIDGNQYVWVEVPMTEEVYPTAKLGITEFNDDAYTKIENDLHTYTATYRNNTNYKDEWYEDTNNLTDWYTQEQYTEQKQKMLKSVYQNGGFWVGRYEAGIAEENNRTSHTTPTMAPQSKKNLMPYNYVVRTEAKKLAEMVTYTKSATTYKGSLMFGVQWDLMLKFIETKKIATDATIVSKLNIDSKDIGNYSNSKFVINRGKYAVYENYTFSNIWNAYNVVTMEYVDKNSNKLELERGSGIILTTGAVDKNSIMNIYDIAGNVCELTLEYTESTNYPCVVRGGFYYDSGSSYPSSVRSGNYRTNSYGLGTGFRICLY